MPNQQYLVKLTWLRGVAASLVVVAHSTRMSEGVYDGYSTGGQINHFFQFFDLGAFGVMLFFSLSGATLYFSNKDTPRGKGLIHFYTKRFFRIWPAYIVALLIYIAFMPIFKHFYINPQDNWIEFQFFRSWELTDLIQYVTLTFNFVGPGGVFNNAFWSLPIEFQYYLMFPLIVLSIKYTSLIGPAIIAILLYAIQKYEWIILDDQKIFLLAYTFCFGVVLAYLYDKLRFRLSKLAAYSLFAISVLACSLARNEYISFGTLPIISNPYGYNGVFGLICVGALLFCKQDLNRENILVRPIVYLGEISYSLYLYHNLILAILLLVVLNIAGDFILPHAWSIFLIVMPISILVAKFSYEKIEKRGIQWSRDLISK